MVSQSREDAALARSQKKIIAACYYAFLVNGFLSLMMGSVLPMLREQYSLPYQISGSLLSAHSVGNLISSFAAGTLPVYMGRKNAIMLLCLGGVLGYFLMTATGNPIFLLLAFFLIGITRGGITNLNNTVVSDLSGGKSSALNFLHAVFAVGAFLCPFAAMIFTSRFENGWKYAAVFVSVLCAFIILFFGASPLDNQPRLKKENRKFSYAFLKDKTFVISTGLLFFYLCTESCVNGLLVTYFADSGIVSPSYAQGLLSLLWLVIMLGRLTVAALSEKLGKRRILIATCFGAALFYVLLMLSRTALSVTVCLVGFGYCLAGIYPTTIANVSQYTSAYPMAMGTITTIAGLGSITMPVVAGAVADRTNIWGGMALVTVAVVLMTGCAISNYFLKREKTSST